MSVPILEDARVKVLRRTKSVCPVCIQPLDAVIVEKDGKIYMEKHCVSHGDMVILISENSQEYKELSDSYFYFIQKSIDQGEYYLCATTQCNAGCPICFLKKCDDKITDLSLSQIEKYSHMKNVKRFTFSHGEATTCESLFEMIKILKGARKMVNIHTNGIKIADFKYALALKSAGINQVSIQFDGFDERVYMQLRGERLLDTKLKALRNLKKLAIPVTLNVTIARGVNEEQIGKTFDYAITENFIKDISFITYCHYEPLQGPIDKYIMPRELLTYIEEYSRKRILKEDIILFQKLFYAYLSIFRKRKCFNYYHFFIVRAFKSYFSISEFINLHKVARALDYIKDKNKRLTRLIFFRILCSSMKIKSLLLFPYGIFIFLRGGYPKTPGMFLAITFATICDPYKYDSSIADNCGQGIITSENIHDSYGTYLMTEIQKHMQSI